MSRETQNPTCLKYPDYFKKGEKKKNTKTKDEFNMKEKILTFDPYKKPTTSCRYKWQLLQSGSSHFSILYNTFAQDSLLSGINKGNTRFYQYL